MVCDETGLKHVYQEARAPSAYSTSIEHGEIHSHLRVFLISVLFPCPLMKNSAAPLLFPLSQHLSQYLLSLQTFFPFPCSPYVLSPSTWLLAPLQLQTLWSEIWIPRAQWKMRKEGRGGLGGRCLKAAIVPSWRQIRTQGLRGKSWQNSQLVNVSDGNDTGKEFSEPILKFIGSREG